MESATHRPADCELLDHVEWIRDLARSLVRDPYTADDLAQQTLLAALRSPSESPRSMRAWLATVLRRTLAQRLRGQGRSEDRERDVARGDATLSTLELVARSSVHAAVVEEVQSLPEHYRDVLLSRYFDGRTPTDIAALQGVPVTTVKTRLQRGLALLRKKLDARHDGDGKSWVAALAPLLTDVRPARIALKSATLVGIATVATVAALIAVVAWIVPSGASQERAGAEPIPAESISAESVAVPVAPTPGTPAHDGERLAVAEPGTDEGESPPTPMTAARSTVRGRVVHYDGAPAPALPVVFEGTNPAATGNAIAVTGPDGSFELRDVRGPGMVRVARTGLATVRQGRVPYGGTRSDVVVVVARARQLAGSIVGPGARPIAGARVELVLADPTALPGHASPNTVTQHVLTSTATDGTFTLASIPAPPGARVRISCTGYVTRELELPAEDTNDLTLELDLAGELVEGRVVDALGNPASGARVALGSDETRADDAGSFRIALPGDFERGTLIALAPGQRPAQLAGERRDDGVIVWGGLRGSPQLTLGGPPRIVVGRVVDDQGRPRAGMEVGLADPTPFRQPRLQEGVGYELFSLLPDERRPDDLVVLVESVLTDKGPALWNPVRTNADGSFRLEGLDDRDYELTVIDPHSLQRDGFSGIAAGREDVELVFDPPAPWRSVSGRVVDEVGDPVPGARILLARVQVAVRMSGEQRQVETTSRRRTVAGTDGTFTLHEVPRDELVALRIVGPNVVPSIFPVVELAEHAAGADVLVGLELEVLVPVRVQVIDAQASGADSFALRDAAGEELVMQRVEGGRRLSFKRSPIESGRSAELSVSRLAETLVMFRGDEEVARSAVTLTAGALNAIRP